MKIEKVECYATLNDIINKYDKYINKVFETRRIQCVVATLASFVGTCALFALGLFLIFMGWPQALTVAMVIVAVLWWLKCTMDYIVNGRRSKSAIKTDKDNWEHLKKMSEKPGGLENLLWGVGVDRLRKCSVSLEILYYMVVFKTIKMEIVQQSCDYEYDDEVQLLRILYVDKTEWDDWIEDEIDEPQIFTATMKVRDTQMMDKGVIKIYKNLNNSVAPVLYKEVTPPVLSMEED